MSQKGAWKAAGVAVTLVAIAVVVYLLTASTRYVPSSPNSVADVSSVPANKAIQHSSASVTHHAPAASQNVAEGNQPTDETSSPPDQVSPGERTVPEDAVPESREEPRVRVRPARAPLTDWNADEATYRARAADESLPRELRSDAHAKATFRFAEWRGRSNGRLGGFEFNLAQIALLSGWEEVYYNDYGPDGLAPRKLSIDARRHEEPYYVQREVWLKRGTSGLHIRMWVAISVHWAHQILLDRQLSLGLSAHLNWGDLNGVAIGDVWFADARMAQQGAVHEGKFTFSRRNAVFEVRLGSTEDSTHTLDLMRLARELDTQVNEQGLQGQTWSDIAEVCPEIVEFEADSLRLKAKGGLRTLIRHKVAADPGGNEILLLTACENGMRVDVHWREPYAEVPYYAPESLPSEPFTVRCWLIAVNTRNLLFTVAEITFTLEKP